MADIARITGQNANVARRLPEGQTGAGISDRAGFSVAKLSDAPRHGRILVREGRFVRIACRRWASSVSVARVWWDSRLRPGPTDECWLDYRGTRRQPGFLTLDYVRSGRRSGLASFRMALRVLDKVAELRRAQAIFAHVSTSAISDRLLVRWGWEPLGGESRGRQWVKRFYDGYPDHGRAVE